jgi:hypothetical protein
MKPLEFFLALFAGLLMWFMIFEVAHLVVKLF